MFVILSLLFLHVSLLSRDRTCTIVNVEGDAFGAGLLQHFADRTSTRTEAQLCEVPLEEVHAVKPESSLLLSKRAELQDV